jgi:hypothetical protein
LRKQEGIYLKWPNLEVYFHGGVNFEPYREQYKYSLKEILNTIEIYNASEGFFAIRTSIIP